MDQRLQLVQDYRSGLFTMSELAEQNGDQPENGLKWIGGLAPITAPNGTWTTDFNSECSGLAVGRGGQRRRVISSTFRSSSRKA